MTPIDPKALIAACESIRRREAGDERYDTIRRSSPPVTTGPDTTRPATLDSRLTHGV